MTNQEAEIIKAEMKDVSYDLCGRKVCNYIDVIEIINEHISAEESEGINNEH